MSSLVEYLIERINKSVSVSEMEGIYLALKLIWLFGIIAAKDGIYSDVAIPCLSMLQNLPKILCQEIEIFDWESGPFSVGNSNDLTLYSLALIQFIKRDYLNCSKTCQQLIEIYPTFVPTFFLLGKFVFFSSSSSYLLYKQEPFT